jgi:TnpA family transposase
LPTRHRIVSSLFEVRKEDEFIRHYTFSTHDLAVIRQHRGAHNRLGELRDCSFENQRYRASGLNLVVAAIILWNTVYLERAISTLRSRRERWFQVAAQSERGNSPPLRSGPSLSLACLNFRFVW